MDMWYNMDIGIDIGTVLIAGLSIGIVWTLVYLEVEPLELF